MISRSFLYLLLPYLTVQLSVSPDVTNSQQNRGRKIFGGYRIEPKKCAPTNGKIKPNQISICMFNYECSRNNGEVVGTCMDGFLFGACCQLPSNFSTQQPILSMSWDDFNKETTSFDEDTTSDNPPFINDLEDEQSFVVNHQSISDPLNSNFDNKETIDTVLRPDTVFQIADPVHQLPGLFSQNFGASNFSGAETDLIDNNGTLLDNNFNLEMLLKATNRSTLSPGYFETSESTTKMEPVSYINTQKFNDLTTTAEDLVKLSTINLDAQFGTKKDDDEDFNREEIAINHIISILNVSTSNNPSPTKISLSTVKEGSTVVDSWVKVEETSQPTKEVTFPYTFYKPVTKPANFYYYNTKSSTSGISSSTKGYTKQPNVILSTGSSSQSYPSSFGSSVTSSSYSYPTKHTYSYSYPAKTTNSYSYPTKASNSYSYQTKTTNSYAYPTKPSNIYSYPTKQTTLQPAPTLIVLGPFGTSDFTTIPTSKPILVKKPTTPAIKPSTVSKKPNVATTITHNINTVISTDDAASATGSNIISTSYINVKLQDSSTINSANDVDTQVVTKKPSNVWTTLSSWSSNKPTFQIKPNKPDSEWDEQNLTPIQTFNQPTKRPIIITSTGSKDCDEETANPDELSNFPPDRNPNLTNSTPISQQEKPTIVETSNKTDYQDVEIINDNDISTPVFIEDDILHTKVNDLVNKIVDSLQDNFQGLKEVVYGKRNVTLPPTTPTKRPTKVKPSSTTRKPATKRPSSTSRPASVSNKPVKVTKLPTKPTAQVNFASQSVTTKRPVRTTAASTSFRPKPTKKIVTTPKPTTTTTIKTTTVALTEATPQEDESNEIPPSIPDFNSECGVRPLVQRNGRVVGGKGAEFGEWPWQVLVREATWLGLFTKNKCGGVLITNKYVITAAHCQPGFLASLVAVFGEYDISGDLEKKRSISKNVKRVIVHRGYNPATFENDVALLELESPVNYEEHIVPICLPEDGTDFTGRMATVTGWGRVKYNGGVPSILQEVQVPVMENDVCQEMFRTGGHPKLILDSFLCAGYSSGQKDSCEGDSGGPLMIEKPDGRWVLIGTVSHGIKCAAPYLPGVYMRTTFFKPWLLSVTRS